MRATHERQKKKFPRNAVDNVANDVRRRFARYPPTFGNGPESLLDVGDGDGLGDDECVGVGDGVALFVGVGDGEDLVAVVLDCVVTSAGCVETIGVLISVVV